MPLRHRIKQNPETIQDLEFAIEEKYWAGLELLTSGHQGSGVYLLGYVAEMILKQACLLLDGAKPHDLVAPRLRPIRTWSKQHCPGISDEHFHSLMFWLQVFRIKRRLTKPMPLTIDSRLTQGVRRLFGIWLVDMRYQPDRSHLNEVRSVYDDVTWLRDHRHHLAV